MNLATETWERLKTMFMASAGAWACPVCGKIYACPELAGKCWDSHDQTKERKDEDEC